MDRIPTSADRAQFAESQVADLFTTHGWHLEPSSQERGPDLMIKRPGQLFVVEVKALAEGRADRALPLLSQAILQAKARRRLTLIA